MIRYVSILCCFFLFNPCALASTQDLEANSGFGLFKGLHKPFVIAGLEEYSPLHGMDEDLSESLRVHGHHDLEDRGYPRPQSRSIDRHVYPQDSVAALLERTCPSHVGLLVNADQKDCIHKWLSPGNLGLLLRVVSQSAFDPSSDKALLDLCEAMVPKTAEDLRKKYAKQNGKPAGLAAYLLKQTALRQPLDFARFLLRAFDETSGDKATQLGYPRHIVTQILLTFMWLKKKCKADLRAYYESFFAHELKSIDIAYDPLKAAIAEILWEGGDSYFTKAEYYAAKKYKGEKNLEISRLLRFGYVYFEDRLPPILTYGISFIDKDTSYSDCGETSLHDLLLMFLYSPDLGIFDWRRLLQLSERGVLIHPLVIKHFKEVCQKPEHLRDPRVRYNWAAVLLAVFNQPQNKGKVKLMHPSLEEGKYGLAAGLDNALEALGMLIQDPEWTKDLSVIDLCVHRLSRLCKIFSPYELYKNIRQDWDWDVRPSHMTGMNNIPVTEIRDPQLVVIRFKLAGSVCFEWHMLPIHFDFVRSSMSFLPPDEELKSKTYQISRGMKKDLFSRYLYNWDMKTVHGRLIAINKILWFQETYHESTYDYLLKRFLGSDGSYMAYYCDPYVNQLLMRLLLEVHKKTIEEIMYMGNLKLSSEMFWYYVQRRDKSSLSRMFDLDLQAQRQEGGVDKGVEFEKSARIAARAIISAERDDVEFLMETPLESYTLAIANMRPHVLAQKGPLNYFAGHWMYITMHPVGRMPTYDDVSSLIKTRGELLSLPESLFSGVMVNIKNRLAQVAQEHLDKRHAEALQALENEKDE